MLATLRRQPWSHSRPISNSRCLRQASVRASRTRPITSIFSSCSPSWKARWRPSSLSKCRPNLSTSTEPPRTSSKEGDERAKELADSSLELYPRWLPEQLFTLSRYADVKTPSESNGTSDNAAPTKLHSGPSALRDPKRDSDQTVTGRIASIRLSGRKLAFIDLEQEGDCLQVMLSYGSIKLSGVSEADFQHQCRLLRRGDHVSVHGTAYQTKSGERSLKATELPAFTAPCLHRFPVVQAKDKNPQDSESPLDRHVEMLTYPVMVDTLMLRDQLINQVRTFLAGQEFTEVQTPILAGMAGGAAARPFFTSATEFAHRKIALRIAPELWLKRLIVGGMSRIYEIGPSFRNEGLDKTHNPEFTTCEFYATYHTLPMLIALTESLLCQVQNRLKSWRSASLASGIPVSSVFVKPFKQIDFVPALNKHLGFELPTLELSNQEEVLKIIESKQIPIPSEPSLPNLLDKLASHYLEPQCNEPTWIVNIPECMSPLSKSFEHPSARNKQRVAARAELFVQGKEVVNCYEEENDPFAQRRKFVEQHTYAANPAGRRTDENVNVDGVQVDEDYLRALEWGLPPTGGWGCGIDRLVMLFAGKERISDVLSFGNLRAVTRNAERRSKLERTPAEAESLDGQTGGTKEKVLEESSGDGQI